MGRRWLAPVVRAGGGHNRSSPAIFAHCGKSSAAMVQPDFLVAFAGTSVLACRQAVSLECLGEILDEKADLRKHRARLSINRDQGRGTTALPIGKNGHKCAGTKLILNVPSCETDNSTSRDGSCPKEQIDGVVGPAFGREDGPRKSDQDN